MSILDLASDHYHYWEEGGCTYHTRYNTWEFARGQEGDPWKPDLRDLDFKENPHRGGTRQDSINRVHQKDEENQSIAQVFKMGEEFLMTNHSQDNWFLTMECFDPHEPYFSPQKYKDLYPHDCTGPHFDWPTYVRVSESPETVEHVRLESAALHSMCDAYLGRVLAWMDEYNLWDDTLLIVNTDHGFLLGEHGWWAKCCQPYYNEVAHAPLFVWDPRYRKAGERNTQLVQTIDLAPTLLEYFGIESTKDMQGVPLSKALTSDEPVREAGLFGMHGAHVNCTDGHYVYMRAPVRPDNSPLNEYTLMPTNMRRTMDAGCLQNIEELAEPFEFTKGCRTLKIPQLTWWPDAHNFGTMLFDLEIDPNQEHPIDNPEVEQRMIRLIVKLMKENDSPVEQFDRLGLTSYL